MCRTVIAHLWAGVLVAGVFAHGRAAEVIFSFGGPSSVSGPPGATVPFECSPRIEHDFPIPGVQGWGIALVARDAVLTSITTEGTSGERRFDGEGASASFEVTQLADPAMNGGRSGAFSVVILGMGNALGPGGGWRIARIGVEVSIPEGTGSAGLEYFDGLVPPRGMSIKNLATVNGSTATPRLEAFTVSTSASTVRFVRGNANGEGGVNISDALWILNQLFGRGPESSCGDAADANDNGGIEISDPILLLNHLFQGSDPPPDPFAVCGADPTHDELDCSAGMTPGCG